jgi:hypothetical protein
MRAPERALREFEFAIGLNANLSAAHAYLGQMKFSLGRARDTRGHVAEAMRLSPRDPFLFHWHFFMGVGEMYLGRVVHGIESLRKSVEINPNWGLSQFVLAAVLALAGLLTEAAEVRAVGQRLVPISPSPGSAPGRRATTRYTLRSASISIGGCAWRECRRAE